VCAERNDSDNELFAESSPGFSVALDSSASLQAMTSETMLRPSAPPASSPAAPSSGTRYVGVADWWGSHVWVERGGVRSALRYRGEVAMPAFAWGRRGTAARELARSILHDATGSAVLAERHCRELTHAVIAQLPQTGFALTREEVLGWLEAPAGVEAG
jgi:uncharacterized protein DUF6166